MRKPKYKIVGWSISRRDDNKYYLTGKCYYNPKFNEGTYVLTSEILKIDFKKGKAETRNSIYILED